MKLHELTIECIDGRFYIFDKNKRGQVRKKRDITDTIIAQFVKNCDSHIVTSEGKKYIVAIREMDKEQLIVKKENDNKKYKIASRQYINIQGWLKQLFRG